MRILSANLYIDRVTDLNPYYFLNRGMKAILVDLDNTILDPETGKVIPDIKEWITSLQEKDIAICFVSNTLSSEKKMVIERALGVKVIINALKPLNIGLRKALEEVRIPNERVAIVGDQTFTDILGGNLLGLHTIRVNPLSETKEDSIPSLACRILEQFYFVAKNMQDGYHPKVYTYRRTEES